MRDIVWTIIIIWIVWKIYDAFKNMSKTQVGTKTQNKFYKQKEGEVKIDHNINQKTHFNPKDAEYVDYEEVK